MGLYTSLKAGTPQGLEDLVGRRGDINLYDLAIKTGSSPQEAEDLAKQSDIKPFLEAKWARQQQELGGIPIGGPPGPDITPLPLWEGVQRTGSNLMQGLKDMYSPETSEQQAGVEQFQAAQAQNQPGPSQDDIMAQIQQARDTNALFSGVPPASEQPGRSPDDVMDLLKKKQQLLKMLDADKPRAEITDPGEPEQTGLTEAQRAGLLDLASGAIEGGRRVGDVPTFFDLMYGGGHRSRFKPETKLAGKAEQIRKEDKQKRDIEEAEAKEIEKGKTDPFVNYFNKNYGDKYGKVQTRQQAEEGIKTIQFEAETGKTKAETDAIKGKSILNAAKATSKEPLSDKEISELSQIDTTVNALQGLLKVKPKFNTGPITESFETVLNFIGAGEFEGLDLSAKNAFKSNVHDMLAQYMKSISGVAISAKEAERLQKAFPKASDDDKTFMKKGKSAVKRLLDRRKIFLDTLEKQGKDVSQLRSMSEGEIEKKETKEGKVAIKGSDGGTHWLPKGAAVGDTFKLRGETYTVEKVLD